MREEIQTEGITRNIGGFSRCLDVAAWQFSELINFSAIGRDCSLPVRTVQSYTSVSGAHLSGLRFFRQENKAVPLYVITTNDEAYKLDGVNILP
ncbi:MAG: hypothetical protein U9R17_12290 [Thermodesulfobacteriota bacterium]|nr:hypothetical protein [Thermodesulfobacteriota bacterium]